MDECELCERPKIETTEHHLTPKEEGGTHKPTAMLCIPCHKQIHALYTNKELATRLYTILLLLADPAVQKFIHWIKKQPIQGRVKTKRSHHKNQSLSR
jgi:5-methylcytosine-specific restriction protein A